MYILCKISSYYKAYVNRENRGVKQLLLNFHNALYVIIVDSLLYYLKFTKSLKIIGFEINPSDLYISNKAIDWSQMKICFHVYNCKLIRHKRKANDRMIKCICQEYESIF